MTDTESESQSTITTDQNHQGGGDNVNRDKNTTNNHHAPVNNIQNSHTIINQHINQPVPKKKRPFNFTIEEDDISPEEAQKYLEMISEVVKKRKQGEKCSITLQFTAKGSTKFILDGDEEDLQILAQLQASGELEELLNELKPDDIPQIKVLEAKFVEDEKVIQKTKLIKKIKEGTVYKKSFLSSHLSRADLREADLKGADLREAYLSGADLRGVDLSGANLSGAYLSKAYLSKADLREANLREADLREANLREADLSGADLRWANLSWANLRWANLNGADLNGADLNRADLRWADLREADLRGANLRGAITNEQTQISDKWRLVYAIVNQAHQNLDLHAQDLSYANLQYSSLSNANLIGANLEFSDLKNAQLQQADLSGANLTDANLTDADLTETVFNYAIVEGAKFGHNQGMTEGLKRDLKAKGAIFVDDFGAGDRELAKA